MNMQALMQQAQRMQKDITNKKNEIDKKEFTGKSDWAEIILSGDKKVKSINILNDDAFDKENKEILCDMLVIAMNDGMSQIDKETEKALGAYSNMGGLF